MDMSMNNSNKKEGKKGRKEVEIKNGLKRPRRL